MRALFILPAALFTVAVVIFPTLFGISIAFTDWNLASLTGGKFNGVDNLVQLWHDAYFWNALGNMVFYVLMVLVEYAIAFGLALLLNAEIVARKFWRVVFLIPFMLSPVAVSWMVGKSMMEYRYGPVARLMRMIGWDQPTFFVVAMDRPLLDRGDGCLGLDPLHHDPAARRPAGVAARKCRRRRASTAPARGSRSGRSPSR